MREPPDNTALGRASLSETLPDLLLASFHPAWLDTPSVSERKSNYDESAPGLAVTYPGATVEASLWTARKHGKTRPLYFHDTQPTLEGFFDRQLWASGFKVDES